MSHLLEVKPSRREKDGRENMTIKVTEQQVEHLSSTLFSVLGYSKLCTVYKLLCTSI